MVVSSEKHREPTSFFAWFDSILAGPIFWLQIPLASTARLGVCWLVQHLEWVK